MNLYFLVEGRQTEPQLYRAWLAHRLPSLREVRTAGEMDGDTFHIRSGNGYPALRHNGKIRDATREIAKHSRITHFFLCVDLEDAPVAKRLGQLREAVEEGFREHDVRKRNPSVEVHYVVAECCPETWFLGHTTMMARNPVDPELILCKQYFDVREDDPQEMGKRDFETRASFHLHYLKAMLRERNPKLSYTKSKPGPVLDLHYLDALRDRCASTGHLSSLAHLFGIWDRLAAPISTAAG